ncbi:hypothetical protein ACERK3_14345 [Phycisphaerales bacterium AB-hyl4]|uniref:DUF2459 domain-containing protein n=1 Tax=Natronomicrosphaera hydrolytica TaxID=3242702 RepID=A0ABV4U798_9BACT
MFVGWHGSERIGRLAKRGLLAFLLVVLLLVWPAGCATTVVPPRDPGDPVTVYLLDHGHTPSLIVPTPEGELARYAFGDMRYYGRGERNVFTGALAMLVPTAGGLGRGVFEDPSSPEAVVASLPVHVDRFYPIVVERDAAFRLYTQLEAQFEEASDTLVSNPLVGLDFVNAGQGYTWFYNSNHAVADWLRELDCDVIGLAYVSRWEIKPAEQSR